MKKGRIWRVLGSLGAGLINGLLGAGGGMLALPVLRSQGLSAQEAHASSIAAILPMSVLSAAIYLGNGSVSLSDALPYLPAGIIGAIAGGILIRKISPKFLSKLFGALALWSGLRLLFSR